jgi:voltage-gated potassium channel
MKKWTIESTGDTSQREALLHRIERITEAPLLVLSFLMIPLLIGPLIWELAPEEEATFVALDTLIWALFAVDLVIKVAITPGRLYYLKKHWLEVLVVVVPFLRPLRLLRIFIFGSRAWVGVRRLVHIDFLLVYGIGLVIVVATIMVSVETSASASIKSFADALWWAMVTITTVGYGDMVPVTATGRAVATVLMLGGIAFFSGVTANLASFMVKSNDTDKKAISQLVKEVEALRGEILKLHESNNR